MHVTRRMTWNKTGMERWVSREIDIWELRANMALLEKRDQEKGDGQLITRDKNDEMGWPNPLHPSATFTLLRIFRTETILPHTSKYPSIVTMRVDDCPPPPRIIFFVSFWLRTSSALEDEAWTQAADADNEGLVGMNTT